MRELSDIKKIIVHCSDSYYGDIGLIDQWHKANGWKGCGYHYVITNGVFTPGKSFNSDLDGIVQRGRDLREVGAHCKGENKDSIGICLIGRHHFTGMQLYQALPSLILMFGDLGLSTEDVYGHCEFSATKTCPNIDPRLLRVCCV